MLYLTDYLRGLSAWFKSQDSFTSVMVKWSVRVWACLNMRVRVCDPLSEAVPREITLTFAFLPLFFPKYCALKIIKKHLFKSQ